jgi:DnaJ-class molecular chaperone
MLKDCQTCKGSGKKPGTNEPCSACRGKGGSDSRTTP